MLDRRLRGREVHGEFSGNSGGTVELFDLDGESVSIEAFERLVVTDIIVVSEATGAISLTFGAPASGKYIVRGQFAANGGVATSFGTVPRYGPLGAGVQCAGPAGQNISVILTGMIYKG